MSLIHPHQLGASKEAFGASLGSKTPISQSTEHVRLFEQLNMPSPPMSPYARSLDGLEARLELTTARVSKPTESDSRNSSPLQHSGEMLMTNTSKPIEAAAAAAAQKGSQCQLLPDPMGSQSAPQSQFPLQDLSESKLVINPFKEFNRAGFKRSQLAFIGAYRLKDFKSQNTPSNSNSRRSNTTHTNNNSTNRSTRYTHYSDNDSATEEKPRTRRTVRQNRFDLVFDSELESTPAPSQHEQQQQQPSTPKRKAPATTAVSSSPKKSRPSTPIVYAYDYNQIEDFCPPLSTLPNSNKCLKADWKGQSMDLTDDPLFDKLHPAEVVLAGTLRLPGNVYLDSKRRIFHEKVKRMRMDLPFRRTDAQKSCKIDVNKASRLFAAFEKVGWLDDHHFDKFM